MAITLAYMIIGRLLEVYRGFQATPTSGEVVWSSLLLIAANSQPCVWTRVCRTTEYKQLVVRLQFPPDYPSSALITELTSKTIPKRLVGSLVKIVDKEVQKNLGSRQVSVAWHLGRLNFDRVVSGEKIKLSPCPHF